MVRKINKPIHSVYNILFNGEDPANYKPRNVMNKLHNYMFVRILNDRKIRLNFAKLLVCIFIELRFPIVLNEKTVAYIVEDKRIKKLHKLLSRQDIRGEQIMQALQLSYWEIKKYFRENFIFIDNCWGFWDIIPDDAAE